MSEIRDLVESYYNDVYIEEEVLDEQGGRLPGPAARKADAERRMQANVARAQAPTKPTGTGRGASGRYQAIARDKAAGGDAAYRAGGGDAAARGGLSRQQIQQRGMSATRANAPKPTQPPTQPAPRPLPAGNPNLRLNVTPAAKVAPATAAKVAPTAAKPTTPAPGTKAAGPESIKPKTPNPLLAGGELRRMQQASQMRQKGINVTSDQIAAAERTKPSTAK